VTEGQHNIAWWVRRQAELAPGRTALEFGDEAFDFKSLDERAARCAGSMAGLGVGPGDRVGALLSNRPEYVDVFLACARLGAVLVPLSTHLAPPELEFIANDSGLRVLIYEGARAETVKAFAPSTAIAAALAVGEGPDPSYEAALAGSDPSLPIADVSEDDVLAIFYTSGTTGLPKGAMLTHKNIFWTNLNMVLALDIVREERSLVVLPLFHVGGWNVNTLAVWWKGGRVVLEPSFEPDRVLDLIDRGCITSIMGVPTIYQRLADHPRFDDTDFSSLRLCICGGAPLSVSLIERWHERDVPFTQGYGLTEAAPNCLFLPPEDAVAKAGAAGRPYFFVDVEVFDQDDEPVGPAGTGEIVVRGPSVMKGYWRRPEETRAALRGGWLRTGDVGRIDEDGYIYVVDRVKDIYISGGENVYPAEVEKVLVGHPSVAEVAIIAVADRDWGEVGRAVVVFKEGRSTTQAELTNWLEGRLARFKLPRTYVFVDALPRNATGKLLKGEIRARYGDSE
jgi:fatty-acyl-CoA synthase